MSVQSEINSRTAKLQAILRGANNSITAKSGTAASNLNGLPAAIDGIPAGASKLQVKGVTPTGSIITVKPDSGYDGLSQVNVAGDANLKAENIAKDVTIYGVTGTHEGDETVEWEEIAITPTGEEITVRAPAGRGIRAVTVEGDENLIRENILISTTIYGVAGKAYSGLQAPTECISRLWEAIYALHTDYTDYINEAIKPGGPNFFVSESDEYVTVGIVRPEGVTVTDYNSDTTEFYSYGWLNYSINKSTGEHEVSNYWNAESPGGNFAKNIKYSTIYIEFGTVTLFPVGTSGRCSESGDKELHEVVNLFPYLSFETAKSTDYHHAILNPGWVNYSVCEDAAVAHSGTRCAAVTCTKQAVGYRGTVYYPIRRASFGHYFYMQGWVKQPVLCEGAPSTLVLAYCGDDTPTAIKFTEMPIKSVGEWELVGGCIYVDHIEIQNANPATEVWLKAGVSVGLDEVGLTTYADDILVVDLTETFGEGNEPTAEECKVLFAEYDRAMQNVYSPSTHAQYYMGKAADTTLGGDTTDTKLSVSIPCQPGDLIVAAIATRDTLTVSDGWTLISTSGINSNDSTGQRLSWAYKFAGHGMEAITVTQASEQRLYINMVAISNATGVTDRGYFYKNTNTGHSITVNKPDGLTLWAATCPAYYNAIPTPGWTSSNNMPLVQLDGDILQPRLMVGLDQSDDSAVTFGPANHYSGSDLQTTIIVGALTIHGIDKFY